MNTNEAREYYCRTLSREGRQAYHAIREGLADIRPVFAVPRLDPAEIADIFFLVRLDHPEIFYASGYKYRFYPEADHIELQPEYIFPKQKVLEHRKALEARVTKLVRPAEKLSEAEKELYVHDFICRNIRYDKLKKPYSHEIIGSLGQGVSVCEGIAKAVKLLCDRLNLPCIIAVSDNNPEKGIKYRHTWNVISLGGQCYHLDATFDNSLGRDGDIRYDYFNLSDRQFFRDHEPVIWPVPACGDDSRSYYREKKLSFTKMEDVARRLQQAARKKKPFLFQWRGSYLTREVLAELLTLINETADAAGAYAGISLNWPQAVLRVRFDKEAPAASVTMEEANEGEQE